METNMFLLTALTQIHNFIESHPAFMPVSGLACSGFAVAMLRAPLDLRPFGVSESESIMNFSSLGTLRCVCGVDCTNTGAPDRRQFCRSCGCEVVVQDASLLEKPLSKAEIRAMTRQLRTAAIRSRNLELPPSITCIDDLNRYLAGSEPTNTKLPPPGRPTTIEQPQIH
jgi:hypothetical protein